MNEIAPVEFERHVERAVGRLSARARRKSAMREELLAHLQGVYAEESERAASPAALEATLTRFGDCDELAKQLEASVPTLERILFMLFSRERRMWWILVLCGAVATLFGTGLVLPALAQLKQHGAFPANGSAVLGLTIGVAIVVSALHLMGWGIVRRMRKTA